MDPPREEGTGFCQLDDGGKVEVARTMTSDQDILDAWVCAACIYSHWLNHGRTTLMVGDMDDGRILLGCQRHG